MNVTVLFTVSRRQVSPGLLVLILALGFASLPVTAEGMTFGRSAGGDRDYAAQPLRETTELTLRDAAQLALQRNPELASFAKEARALEGATLQAGLLRNPELIRKR